jgi:hypothetical protein
MKTCKFVHYEIDASEGIPIENNSESIAEKFVRIDITFTGTDTF